jgi:lysophospholipase L1-like esterase
MGSAISPGGRKVMGRRCSQRLARFLFLAVAAGAGTLGGASGPALAASTVAVRPTGAPALQVMHVLGLGDSTLSSAHCNCPGLLMDYAGLAAERLRTRVRVRNYASPSATTEHALQMLQANRERSDVRSADLVVIFIGANDFGASFNAVARGESAEHNFGPVADRVERNVGQILREIKELNSHARVILCGYWNDFKDGAVARHVYSPLRRWAAEQATDYTNTALRTAAAAAGVEYLSTRQVFQSKGDVTPLLAPDGDHLSAAGHRVVADELINRLNSGELAAAPSSDPDASEPPDADPTPTSPTPAEAPDAPPPMRPARDFAWFPPER